VAAAAAISGRRFGRRRRRRGLRTPPGLTGSYQTREKDVEEEGGCREVCAEGLPPRQLIDDYRSRRCGAAYGSCSRPGARHRTGLTGRHQTADFKCPGEEQGGRLPHKKRTTLSWPRRGRRGLRRQREAFSHGGSGPYGGPGLAAPYEILPSPGFEAPARFVGK